MMNINDNNYELWLLRYAEQELTAAERTEVEQWLAVHPEAAEELALYNEAPRLERDENVHYDAKPMQHTVPLWQPAVRWAAAAAVVVALMLPGLRSTTSPAPRLVAENTPLPVQTEVTEIPTVTVKKVTTAKPTEPEHAEVAIVEEAPMPIKNTVEEEEPQAVEEALPAPQETLLYVDNLIVYDTTPEPEEAPTEELAVAYETYIRSESSVNPIGLFISTFIKANK